MSRRSNIDYFKNETTATKPLTVETERRVRFEEVDPLSIVWHGRYPGYFEDGRAALGEKYHLSYLDMYRERFLAPIVQIHIDYHNPLYFSEDFKIITSLHWTKAVKLNFSYKIINSNNKTIASGYTVQLFIDLNREVLLVRPEYIENFFTRWQENRL